MKQFLLIFLFSAFSGIALGQNLTDQEAILQNCIDLQEMQAHFPKDNDQNYKAVHIMQYPIVFREDVNIVKFGEKPVFMSRHEIYDNAVEAYFLFKKIEVTNSSANVDFSFYYDYTSARQKVMHVLMELAKEEENWKINKTDIQYY